jgi:hypothetical protein
MKQKKTEGKKSVGRVNDERTSGQEHGRRFRAFTGT